MLGFARDTLRATNELRQDLPEAIYVAGLLGGCFGLMVGMGVGNIVADISPPTRINTIVIPEQALEQSSEKPITINGVAVTLTQNSPEDSAKAREVLETALGQYNSSPANFNSTQVTFPQFLTKATFMGVGGITFAIGCPLAIGAGIVAYRRLRGQRQLA